MSIPRKFEPFFPIRRTGSADNERAQLNKLLRLIIGELGISQDTSFEEAIAELEKKLEAVESGDNASVIWGQIFGNLTNQEDLQEALDKKLDEVYPHIKKADGPPTTAPEEGELIYYTTVELQGSVKVTEHKVRDAKGNDTVILSFEEIL